MEGFVTLAALLAIYFAPAWVAKGRNHSRVAAIFALNLLLGWTALGWIAALVWAFTERNPEDARRKCPECAEMIKREAHVCRYCGHKLREKPLDLTQPAD